MDPLRPDTPERLAEALRGIASDHIAIRLGGNFSKDRVGGAVTDAGATVSTTGMKRLLQYRFEWVLPGHGRPIHLPAGQMLESLERCVEWMEER